MNKNQKTLFDSLSPNWTTDGKFLNCTYNFKDFTNAMKFFNLVSNKCEKMNHHPKWTNIYNIIEIELYTHDKKKLTKKDFKLSSFMDKIYKQIENQ